MSVTASAGKLNGTELILETPVLVLGALEGEEGGALDNLVLGRDEWRNNVAERNCRLSSCMFTLSLFALSLSLSLLSLFLAVSLSHTD